METLGEEQSKKSMGGRSKQKVKSSLPGEIIEEILCRLHIKTILQFRSVSKQWRSLISAPSFTNLHFNRSTTALFISAYDTFKRKLYFFSAAHDGGSLTHLMTLDDAPPFSDYLSHLNGLVCFTSANGFSAFVINPSTRKNFKVPHPPTNGDGFFTCYFFGFDEPRTEHKILNISFKPPKPYTFEISIFSLTNYSWRKVNAELPIGTDLDSYFIRRSVGVCVDSVIHLMLGNPFDILMFDLITEKFSKITTPENIVPYRRTTPCKVNRKYCCKCNKPRIIIINGCVGVVCHDRVLETNEMHIWILQDYESRVWVKETITFPKSWAKLDCPFPHDYVKRDEVIFSPRRLSMNAISVPIYNMHSRCFKFVRFTLNHPLLRLKDVEFIHIKCYAECIVPLEANKTRT